MTKSCRRFVLIDDRSIGKFSPRHEKDDCRSMNSTFSGLDCSYSAMAKESAAGPKPTQTTSYGLSAVLVVGTAAVALEVDLGVDMTSLVVGLEIKREQIPGKKTEIENSTLLHFSLRPDGVVLVFPICHVPAVAGPENHGLPHNPHSKATSLSVELP